jgi:hypothetical protein
MSTVNSKINKSTQRHRLRLVVAGVTKHFGNVSSLTLGGATVTVSSLVQSISDLIKLFDAADAELANYHASVKTARDAAASLRSVLRALKAFVFSQFGDTSASLVDFGYSPRKARTPSVATKALAAAKLRATREARHTQGKRQKQDVHGVVTAPAAAAPAGAQTAATATTTSPGPKPGTGAAQ